MKIVAIRDMSVGNDTVGDMWKETKIFDGKDTLEKLMQWAGEKKNVVVTIPEGEELPTNF